MKKLGSLRRLGITFGALALLLGAASLVPVGLLSFHEHPEPPRAAGHRPIAPVTEGVQVRQEFQALDERIAEVQLELATYARENAGTIELRVEAQEAGGWRRLGKRTARKSKIVNDAWRSFVFSPALAVRKGQPVALILTADNGLENAITWYMAPDFRPPGTRLLLNGVEQAGTASFRVGYQVKAGRAGGPMWPRLTIFLGPLGQGMLVFGLLLALFALVHLLLWPTRNGTQE